MSGETTGDLAPEFKIFETKVRGVVLKGAKGVVGNTTFSIMPSSLGIDRLEVAFSPKTTKTEDEFIGEPVRINARQEDLEEVADTINRYLTSGESPEKILKHLDEMD